MPSYHLMKCYFFQFRMKCDFIKSIKRMVSLHLLFISHNFSTLYFFKLTFHYHYFFFKTIIYMCVMVINSNIDDFRSKNDAYLYCSISIITESLE